MRNQNWDISISRVFFPDPRKVVLLLKDSWSQNATTKQLKPSVGVWKSEMYEKRLEFCNKINNRL